MRKVPELKGGQRKFPGGDISYPSPACTKVLKEKVKEKIANGDIQVGKEIVKFHTHPTELTKKMKEKTVKEISVRKFC